MKIDNKLEWYTKCDKCFAYVSDIEQHRCDWLMSLLVEYHKRKIAKEWELLSPNQP